jgi:hypothetical protein
LTILVTELAVHWFHIKPHQELLQKIQHNSKKDIHNMLLECDNKGYVEYTETMKQGKVFFGFLQQKSFYVGFSRRSWLKLPYRRISLEEGVTSISSASEVLV